MKEVLAFLVFAALLMGFMYLTYDKGRRDERFQKQYCCCDCGDLRDDDIDGMCRDCRRKYYGEMDGI